MFHVQQTSLGLHVRLFRCSFCSVIIKAKFGRKLLDLALRTDQLTYRLVLPIPPGSERREMEATHSQRGPLLLRNNKVRNVAPHFSGNGRQQQINLPVVGGKFPAAQASCREFIVIMAAEWRTSA
jgi:hypothetical protein